MKRGPGSPDCGEVVCSGEGAVRLGVEVVVPAVAGTGRGGDPGISWCKGGSGRLA